MQRRTNSASRGKQGLCYQEVPVGKQVNSLMQAYHIRGLLHRQSELSRVLILTRTQHTV